MIEALKIPDIHGRATSIQALYFNSLLPSNIPGLCLPPILHPDLVTHRIFKRRKWHRQKYTMTRFLESDALRNTDEKTRGKFWKWICKNERRVVRERPKLADLAIWPDENGDLRKIFDLCNPRSPAIGEILADSIHRPHPQVRCSKLVSIGGRTRTSIRYVPTEDEIRLWLDTRLAGFELGKKPNAAAIRALHRLEADLVTLLRDTNVARSLKAIEVRLPALDKDGWMRPRTQLVMPKPGTDRLALLGRFLLAGRQPASALNNLSPALSEPTPAMLLDTFSEDPENVSSLLPRLRQFLSVTKPDSDERCKLAEMPIIHVKGEDRPLPPSALAFISKDQDDYWGDWKTRIPLTGLSQDDRIHYREAGVTSVSPNWKKSRDFFRWLSTQDQTVLQHHMPCVLRHILHKNGPTNWGNTFPDEHFIPVESRDGLNLISLQMARRSRVYRPDAESTINEDVIQRDPSVLLTILHVKEINQPISQQLRDLKIRSLRDAMGQPVSVGGVGETTPVDEKVQVWFDKIRSSQFRDVFLKRLSFLEIEEELIQHDWHSQLSKVRKIFLADKVKACYHFRNKYYFLPN